ncbi:unnamed protein product, partial [Ectocarpus sp. 12 AP-2014]
GYYAGFVGSSLGFGRFLSAYVWGYISDSYGRKPAIAIGLAATATLSIAFGVSTTLAFAVASRFALGLLNGGITPALRVGIRDICGE